MPDDPLHPDQPDGQQRFRADLAAYLDSLPAHKLADLLGELPSRRQEPLRLGVLMVALTSGSRCFRHASGTTAAGAQTAAVSAAVSGVWPACPLAVSAVSGYDRPDGCGGGPSASRWTLA